MPSAKGLQELQQQMKLLTWRVDSGDQWALIARSMERVVGEWFPPTLLEEVIAGREVFPGAVKYRNKEGKERTYKLRE